MENFFGYGKFMPESQKMGRPKKPEEDLRSKVIRTCVTASELHWIEAEAEKAGMSKSAWVREKLLFGRLKADGTDG